MKRLNSALNPTKHGDICAEYKFEWKIQTEDIVTGNTKDENHYKFYFIQFVGIYLYIKLSTNIFSIVRHLR